VGLAGGATNVAGLHGHVVNRCTIAHLLSYLPIRRCCSARKEHFFRVLLQIPQKAPSGLSLGTHGCLFRGKLLLQYSILRHRFVSCLGRVRGVRAYVQHTLPTSSLHTTCRPVSSDVSEFLDNPPSPIGLAHVIGQDPSMKG